MVPHLGRIDPSIARIAYVNYRHVVNLETQLIIATGGAKTRERELSERVDALLSQLVDRAKRRAIREQLAVFLAQAEELKRKCLTETQSPPPQREADGWATRVAKYLRENLDSSYVAQFRDPPPGWPISHSGVPEAHNGLWAGIERHAAVLRKFIDTFRDKNIE